MQPNMIVEAGKTVLVQLFLLYLVLMVKSLDRQLEGNVWESSDIWRPKEQARTIYISSESMTISHRPGCGEVQGRNSMGTQLLPRSKR